MEKRSLPVALESLAELRRYAGQAAIDAGIDAARAYKLQLAVDEIATNVIVYGYQNAGGTAVMTISCERAHGALVITLEDHAPAFDPRSIAMPSAEDLTKPLDERDIGGLGIFLTIQGVDRFEYRRVGDSNLNIFEVRLGHD
jgi:anti-sigma regulatory factor (Ser/Thr protein kinase)